MKLLKQVILEAIQESLTKSQTVETEVVEATSSRFNVAIGFDINVGIDKMREDFDKIKSEVIKFAKKTGDSYETDDSNKDTFNVVINYDFSDSKIQHGILKHTMETAKKQNVKSLKDLGADYTETESYWYGI